MRHIFAMGAIATVLSGCMVTPQSEQTPLNMVEFQNGELVRVSEPGPQTIICQDYWQHFTYWDRATSFPVGMTYDDATAVCRSREQMMLEAPTAQPLEIFYNTRTNHPDAYIRDTANASSGAQDVWAR